MPKIVKRIERLKKKEEKKPRVAKLRHIRPKTKLSNPKAESKPKSVFAQRTHLLDEEQPARHHGKRAQLGAGQHKKIHEAQAQVTAACVADPLEAYRRGLQPSLPFSVDPAPLFGYWSRMVIPFTETNSAYGVPHVESCVTVTPSAYNTITVATGFNASTGAPNAFVSYSDVTLANQITNFSSVTVAVQGFRVRNVTMELYLGGENTVGTYSYIDRNTSYELARQNANSCSTAAAPGTYSQMNYIGNPRNSGSGGNINDYTFINPSTTTFDPDMRCMYFRSFNGNAGGQYNIYELEVVTYYLAQPYYTDNQLFRPVSRPIDASTVADSLSDIQAMAPRFAKETVVESNSGLGFLWDMTADACKVVAGAAVNMAADFALTTISSLWLSKPHVALARVLAQVPPEEYDRVARFFDEHKDKEAALATIQDQLRIDEQRSRIKAMFGDINIKTLADSLPDGYDDAGTAVAPPSPPTSLRAAAAAVSRGQSRAYFK